MKKLLFFLFAVLLSCSAWAYDAYIDGIYYNFKTETKEAEVTFKDNNYRSYSGNIIIPSSVTYSNVTYSVTSIGQSAFVRCTDLETVTIPNSVTSIGDYAFQYCTGLTSIEIPNGVTSIGSEAFYGCTNMTSIDFSNSVTSIGGYAFYNTAWYNNQSDGLIYAGKVAYKYKGAMPQNTSIILKDGTTGISGSAFENCTGLASIEIPSSVTSIGRGAFYGCTGLTSITIPNGVRSIDGAFSGCTGLTSIEIPNGVTSIGGAFSGCTGLTSISIPNSITSIGNGTFQNCKGLTSIEIPSSVTSIGRGAFYNCTGLTSITIPNGVTSIGSSAFYYCKGLTSITIPNGVTTIGEHTFEYCTGLTSIEIPNGVTSIGECAFYNCKGLTSIEIPNSVTSIGSSAFDGCTGLTSVKITDISAWCNIQFGNYVGTNPLYYAHDLYLNDEKITNLTISEGVTSIGQCAFNECTCLTSIEIPNSVTSIGGAAFSGCTGLTSIKVNWNRPLAISTYVWNGVDKTACTLYVPKGTAMMYMSATGWNEFTNILEYEDGEDAHYITIRMGDGGELQQSVELGKIYIYKVKADEGWAVNTLTFNGQDMTGQLLDGQFSTPVITGDAELNVVFKQEASNIKSMKQTETTKVKVYAYNGTVKVAGAEDYTEVVVYNAGGILVANGEGNCSISLDSGIYIVKVGNETFKVSL